eukprot:5121232-Amphidinium_carterae.1
MVTHAFLAYILVLHLTRFLRSPASAPKLHARYSTDVISKYGKREILAAGKTISTRGNCPSFHVLVFLLLHSCAALSQGGGSQV